MSSTPSEKFVGRMRGEPAPVDSPTTEPPLKTGIPRFAEAILALAGIILSAPLLAVSSVAVAITSPGPVLFRQKRVGHNGQIFILYKLRTMYQRNNGPQITSESDSRITPVGRILRKTKIDELPELWNVLKGDMSLVGPRPEVPRYVDMKNTLWQQVLRARPGITDPVTLLLRNEQSLLVEVKGDHEQFYIKSLQPFKLKRYLVYLQERSWWTDVKVLWNTCIAVLMSSKAPPPTLEEIMSSAKDQSL